MAMFLKHVRWLYNLIRVASDAAVFEGVIWGSHQQEPFRQSQRGFLACIAERDKGTHSQAGVLIILLHR